MTTRPPNLPLCLAPLPDEVFTSWVVRHAAAYKLSATAFSGLISGLREFKRDMDGPAGEPILLALCARTGFCPDELREHHTLNGFNGRLFSQARTNTASFWVLPIGGARKRPSMQFCSLCLASDEIPYFRRAWRLSLFVVCPVHSVRLRHLCPSCDTAVSLLRGHSRHEQGATPLCWRCGLDLRGAPAEPAFGRDVDFARDCHELLYEGVPPTCRSLGIETGEYLAALSIVCMRLSGDRARLRQWREVAAAGVKAELPAPVRRSGRGKAAFGTLSDPALRLPILRTAGWLLEGWPGRFLQVAEAAGTCTSDFTRFSPTAPAWFLGPLRTRLTPVHHAPPPTPGAVRAARIREMVVSLRPIWRPREQHLIVLALRKAGFYKAGTSDQEVLFHVRGIIAKQRVQEIGSQRRATWQMPRRGPGWRRLRALARPFRKDRCRSLEEVRRGICLLCEGTYLSAFDLSELLGRYQGALSAKHLTLLVRQGRLETRFGECPNGYRSHPRQAYRSLGPASGGGETKSYPLNRATT